MFSSVGVFCHMSICYALMNPLFPVFLQKAHNRLQNVNKSFNLVIPRAKLKSHIYLARNKPLLVNDIFCLTWCEDLWSVASVPDRVWMLICMWESQLCCVIDLGSSPSLCRVTTCVGDSAPPHHVYFPLIYKARLFFPCVQSRRELCRWTHRFDLTHISVSSWRQTEEGECGAV